MGNDGWRKDGVFVADEVGGNLEMIWNVWTAGVEKWIFFSMIYEIKSWHGETAPLYWALCLRFFFSSSGNVACRSDWEPYVLILVFFSVSFWDWFKSPKRVVESWIWWSFEFWFFRWSLHLAFSHDQICLQTVNVLIHISYIQIHNHWHRKKSSLTFQLVDCLSTGWDFWEGPSFLGHTQMMFQPSYS